MESHKDPSSFSSLQQLIEELGNLITLEFDRNGNPWTSMTRLAALFYEKYGVTPEDVARDQFSSNGLRSIFTRSGCFSIRATSIPKEFYVALSQEVGLDFQKFQAKSIKDKDIPPCPVQRISKYQPTIVSEFQSVHDLEIALVEIIKSLAANHPKENVTIGVLSKKFYDYYQQPIRTVIRSVFPGMRLIELLQTIPRLHVQKLDNDWQITLTTHSVE